MKTKKIKKPKAVNGTTKKQTTITRKTKNRKNKASKKNIRIWSFSRRLLAMCLIPMMIVCVLIATLSTITSRNNIEQEIYNSLQIVATSVNETYTNLYEGDYTVDFVGKIWKGDTDITNDYQLIEALKEKTGFDVSLLFGNMRLITTLTKENGTRANGIPTDKEVYKQIENGETLYFENMMIVKNECYVYYLPLINTDGSVIGAIEVTKDCESINQQINAQIMEIVLFSVIVVIIAALIVGFVSQRMVKRMGTISGFLENVMQGRLDHVPNKKQLKINDEIGDIYRNCMKVQDTFEKMVGEIKASCDNLKYAAESFSAVAQSTTEASDGVRIAVEEISNGAINQADSTATAQDNMNMINNQIGLIIKEVDDMTECAISMSMTEKQSEEIIGELSISSDHTKESVIRVAEQVTLMNDAVNSIKQAVGMIQDIASETDLLSLNASIEAARAGDAGRGFAVVAEQICKLALQSNESGRDIERILREITETVDTMVVVMDEVRANMDVQQQKLEETRMTYRVVGEGVDKSLENISNIKQKIDVLNNSGESISATVQGLAAISEQNVASASETMDIAENMNSTVQIVRETSDELIQLAARLQEVIGSFYG